MSLTKKQLAWFAVGALWTMLTGRAAWGDDTELFVGMASASSASRPNILLIIDNSGSMGDEILTQDTYNPASTYAGTCSTSVIYWRTNTGTPPDCATARYFNNTAMMCQAGLTSLASAGEFTDQMAQYNDSTGRNGKTWGSISQFQRNRLVECQDDNGVHGDGNPAANVYPLNGATNAQDAWQATPGGSFSWAAQGVYTVYSGNYLNWYYGPTHLQQKLQVVKDVANSLLNSINGVNIGLMVFNDNQGGYVLHAMENIATARSSMISQINALTADTWTPLSETLYEAGLYYAGKAIDYGTSSVSAARDPGNNNVYNSPLTISCQKNFVVILTDGGPTKDNNADSKIVALKDANGAPFGDFVSGGVCDADTLTAPDRDGTGMCLDDMAEFLHKGDQSTLPGDQHVDVYTIGFTVDLPLLAETAARGGGAYYTANDTASLSNALTNIVTSILDTQTTFLSPTVSVNSFNRTQNLNDLFISVFKASGSTHWPGNLKKYRLDPSTDTIVDAAGKPAVDAATGFFADTSQSYWSAATDGSDIQAGGAANKIPVPTARKVYTYISGTDLTAPANRISTTNAQLTDAMLNIGNPGDPTHVQLVNFINGLDVTDVDQDNNTTEARNQMGDPLHAQPATVIYGPSVDDSVVYFATNDGFLHAIDAKTGIERWAFIPPDFLKNQVDLYFNESRATKEYGIDGSLRVQMLSNGDGVIGPGEKVYLFFGVRRGGDVYYGLDVTNPDAPQFMWRLDATNLPGVGQSWATPVPARMNIAGWSNPNNPQKFVLVMGGGYEVDQDNVAASTDTSGNSIYIVDSVSGSLLWRGSKSGGTKNFAVSNKSMDYSIPADVKVIDFDGDGFADRMYAADMGGQVWRFDVQNGQPASTLINGGVIAQLGAAPSASPAAVDTRRFYYSPDVALVSTKDYHFVHVGIGSGHRAHPLSLANEDRFYALRDNAGLAGMTQAAYDAFTPIKDSDLVDVTTDINAVVPQGSPGWKLLLDDGGWQGEKVLAESRTFNNQVFFTTFTPSSSATSCEPQLGTNKLYVMSLFNGAPVTNLDGSQDPTTLTETDRYKEFTGSISSEVTFIFPSPDNPNCVGDQCTPPPVACVDLFCFPPGFGNAPVRTFWSQTRVD
jgi:type IV pilus assembly protein PilY1